MLITTAQLAKLATEHFTSDPELVASTMISVQATLEDLVDAAMTLGYVEAHAREMITEVLTKHSHSVNWQTLGQDWDPKPVEPKPLTQVVAKFAAGAVAEVPFNNQTYVRMHAVYETDPNSPNKAFTDATPSGDFSLWITNGLPAASFFKTGKKYLLTITEAKD